MPDILLGFVSVAFAAMGVAALARPVAVTAQFGIPQLDVDGRNEVRAVYGGFGLTISAALGLALFAPDMRAGIALTVALALAGMALGRLISMALDGRMGRYPALYLGIECVGAALLVYAAGWPGSAQA